jgi:Tfp pilus assembly protein PilO
MRALFSVGGHVAIARVLREHRAALVPLAIVLVVNVIVLMAVVLPLTQRVESNEQRAETAELAQSGAEAELKQAEALRDGKARATTDLDTFYKQVLPADAAGARRITHLKLQQKAREHNVQFERSATKEETLNDSSLERQTISMNLSGDWDDIRTLIYDLETSPDFVVIDNIVIGEGMTGDAALALSLELSTYYRSSRPARARVGGNGR